MAPNPFRDILLDTEAVVLDGGLATELEANGKNLSVRGWAYRSCAFRTLSHCALGDC